MENQLNLRLTPNGFLKTISIVHLVILAGPFLFGIYAYLKSDPSKLDTQIPKDFFLYLLPLLAIFGYGAGLFLFKQQIKALSKKQALREKLAGYQTATIIRYALLEGPAMLGVILFLNSRNIIYLIVALLLVAYLFTLKPSKLKVENDLSMNSQEMAAFNNADQPL